MKIEQEKLAKAVAALWVFLSIPISQDLYDEVLNGGLFMRIFALLAVAAPIWLVFGWRWLTNKMPIPLKCWGSLLVLGVISAILFANSYDLDEIAYIPLVVSAAFLVMVWIYERSQMIHSVKNLVARKHPQPVNTNTNKKLESEEAKDLLSAVDKAASDIMPLLARFEAPPEPTALLEPIASPIIDGYKIAYALVFVACKPHLLNIKVNVFSSFRRAVANLTIQLPPGEEIEQYSDDQLSPFMKQQIEPFIKAGTEVRKNLDTKQDYPFFPLYALVKSYGGNETNDAEWQLLFEDNFAEIYIKTEKHIRDIYATYHS